VLLGLALILALLGFAGIGIAHILKPDRFLKRSRVRRGGGMLTEYNRAGFEVAGAVFAAAIYMLYSPFATLVHSEKTPAPARF
jgi:hypothetical protein